MIHTVMFEFVGIRKKKIMLKSCKEIGLGEVQ